jgi:hypothetical protein
LKKARYGLLTLLFNSCFFAAGFFAVVAFLAGVLLRNLFGGCFFSNHLLNLFQSQFVASIFA